MDCFATTFILDETRGFLPKEGMSWKKLISLMTWTQNSSYGPQSCTSSYIMGPWIFLSCSIRSPLTNSRKSLSKNSENTSNYPCQRRPPVPENPSWSDKKGLPKENLEGTTNSFAQRVVKRCGVVLLKKFRYAPTLKPLDATSKELKWIFCMISFLVQVSRWNLLLSPS